MTVATRGSMTLAIDNPGTALMRPTAGLSIGEWDHEGSNKTVEITGAAEPSPTAARRMRNRRSGSQTLAARRGNRCECCRAASIRNARVWQARTTNEGSSSDEARRSSAHRSTRAAIRSSHARKHRRHRSQSSSEAIAPSGAMCAGSVVIRTSLTSRVTSGSGRFVVFESASYGPLHVVTLSEIRKRHERAQHRVQGSRLFNNEPVHLRRVS